MIDRKKLNVSNTSVLSTSTTSSANTSRNSSPARKSTPVMMKMPESSTGKNLRNRLLEGVDMEDTDKINMLKRKAFNQTVAQKSKK
jgi:hypothetical protein